MLNYKYTIEMSNKNETLNSVSAEIDCQSQSNSNCKEYHLQDFGNVKNDISKTSQIQNETEHLPKQNMEKIDSWTEFWYDAFSATLSPLVI